MSKTSKQKIFKYVKIIFRDIIFTIKTSTRNRNMDSKGKEKEPDLSYYYKKPGSKDGDPSIVMSINGLASKGGEIIIGKEDFEPSVERMIVLVVKVALDPEFHKMIEKQKTYFGEKNYEPARKELIRMAKSYLKKLKDRKVNLPIQVNKIIFDGDWKF